ncbi:DUF364 domain-containing protein [uncultured Microbulbifer sp.]|uniref:Rossmann-like domain-containing protein n=1 Tax=uncultured Microbulbifer sp. TaxID=348147 RepID=UPI00261F2D08|nr:DUF364 domain-containing protein [uncultured Microbulbifer sp.]
MTIKSQEALPVDSLITQVLQGQFALDAHQCSVAGAFAIRQFTKFPGANNTYRNFYLLLRVESVFGGCCVEPDQLDIINAESLAGVNLANLLECPILPVRIAALDAYFALLQPHRNQSQATRVELPQGTPYERAIARDQAIVSLQTVKAGENVGLIGVVNPIVEEIEKRGAYCLPCDFNMKRTSTGLNVTRNMDSVLRRADRLIVTGMTLSNGSFDTILQAAKKRNIPLLVYAQTGSAIVPQFLGKGVSAVCAEPFPYSQFSAEPSSIYLYRAD